MKYQLVFAAIGGRPYNTQKTLPLCTVLVRALDVFLVPGAFVAPGDKAPQ